MKNSNNGVEIRSLQEYIENERRMGATWREIATVFGVNVGSVYRVAQGYEPKTKRLRKAFGLPAYAPAPCCHICGEVHVSKRCTRPRQLPGGWEDAVQFLIARERMK